MLLISTILYFESFYFFGFDPYGFYDFIDLYISLDSSSKGMALTVIFATFTALITLIININEKNNDKKYDDLIKAYESIMEGFDLFDDKISDIMASVRHVSVCNMLYVKGEYSEDEYNKVRYKAFHNLIDMLAELRRILTKNQSKQVIYANELLGINIDIAGDEGVFGVALNFIDDFGNGVMDFIYESGDENKIDFNVVVLDNLVSDFRKESIVSVAELVLKIKGDVYKKGYINIRKKVLSDKSCVDKEKR